MLIVEKLTGGYLKGQPVLEGLGFQLKAGDMLLVTGENGAGKSSLVRALAGELPWCDGRIVLGDIVLDPLPTWQRSRAGLGFGMQGGEVFSRLTGEENIRMATHKSGKTVLAEMIPWLAERLPMLSQPLFHGKAGNYSGGERAQLALAITLATKPSLLVLDEPFAGLSGANLLAVAQTIRDYTRDFGKAMILIEQNIPIASGICNRTATLRQKQLFAR